MNKAKSNNLDNNNGRFTMFIDESGLADLTDKTYRNFILTSIIIPQDELSHVSGYFSFIKRKYNLEDRFPFHTYDLLENPESEIRLTTTEGKKVC